MKKKIYLLILLATLILMVQSCSFFRKSTMSETPNEGPQDLGEPITQYAAEQNAAEHNATASVLLGVQKSSILGGESWEDPFGVQAGVIVPFLNLGETMNLRAEANISMQGAKWAEYDLEGKTSLLYLNVPIVFRYQHRSNFYGEAGIQPGFLLSAKDKYEETTEDYMDQMNRFDLSIPIGIGYEFKNNFGVGLRVIPGIIDITQDEDEKDVNFVIALRGTYTFKKK